METNFAICLLWGTLLGIPGFMTGVAGMRQIRKNQGKEAGSKSAVIGILLGGLGSTLNILCVYLLFLSFAID